MFEGISSGKYSMSSELEELEMWNRKQQTDIVQLEPALGI
jgi:hypothetical protein